MIIQFTQCFPCSAQLLTFFRRSIYSMLVYLDEFASFPSAHHICDLIEVYQAIILIRAITCVAILQFLFPFCIPIDTHLHCLVSLVSQHVLLAILIDTFLKSVLYYLSTHRTSGSISTVLLSISYLYTFIVYRSIFLLILVILIRPCVSFLLMWSVHSLLVFCLLILLLSFSLIVCSICKENCLF